MDKIMSAGLFDYFDATFETPFERVCYYFQLICAEETLYHYAEQTEEIPPEKVTIAISIPISGGRNWVGNLGGFRRRLSITSFRTVS